MAAPGFLRPRPPRLPRRRRFLAASAALSALVSVDSAVSAGGVVTAASCLGSAETCGVEASFGAASALCCFLRNQDKEGVSSCKRARAESPVSSRPTGKSRPTEMDRPQPGGNRLDGGSAAGVEISGLHISLVAKASSGTLDGRRGHRGHRRYAAAGRRRARRPRTARRRCVRRAQAHGSSSA